MSETGAAVQRIVAKAVSKRFGWHRALANVDLELRPGSLCALLGANGAGKSTLLGIFSTLVRPTSGEVVYDSGDGAVAEGMELRQKIGVLAHEAFVYSGLTAVENLQFWGRLYNVDDLDQRIDTLLGEVGLDKKARARAAGTYSRGMLQRLALARTLLHDPSVLLLDEPFTGLDRTGAAALASSLATAKESNKVVMVITHDLESIGDVTDHVVMLSRGKVVHDDRDSAGFSYERLKEIYHQFGE
jgi:ABC-type multidrug transport system ATPase subunit